MASRYLEFTNQNKPKEILRSLASKDKHSLIIEGPEGSGKTYLSRYYSRLLNIPDFVSVTPKVSDVKSVISVAIDAENPIVFCIENLDSGVLSSSYVLLKFMEEPRDNIYFMITCNKSSNIPDTLISRSMVVSLNSPTRSDIDNYCKHVHADKYTLISSSPLYLCISNFKEADEICSLSKEQIDYIIQWKDIKKFNDSVSNISWKLNHFIDNKEFDSRIIIKYIINCNKYNKHIVSSCISCMNQLDKNNMSKSLILSKLAFELKYCE